MPYLWLFVLIYLGMQDNTAIAGAWCLGWLLMLSVWRAAKPYLALMLRIAHWYLNCVSGQRKALQLADVEALETLTFVAARQSVK